VIFIINWFFYEQDAKIKKNPYLSDLNAYTFVQQYNELAARRLPVQSPQFLLQGYKFTNEGDYSQVADLVFY
jgi:hypothetical protein